MTYHAPQKNKPRGRPTWFRGKLYRSDAEAKVAAFLYLIGWVVEHERTPLDTHGYIPDFYVIHPEECLIEVKADHEEFDEAVDKILASGWTGRFAVVFRPDCYRGYLPALPADWETKWAEAGNLVMWEPKNQLPHRVMATPALAPVHFDPLPLPATKDFTAAPPLPVPALQRQMSAARHICN